MASQKLPIKKKNRGSNRTSRKGKSKEQEAWLQDKICRWCYTKQNSSLFFSTKNMSEILRKKWEKVWRICEGMETIFCLHKRGSSERFREEIFPSVSAKIRRFRKRAPKNWYTIRNRQQSAAGFVFAQAVSDIFIVNCPRP